MTEEHIDTVDYAMDVLDEVARRRAERHLQHCAVCRAEVAQWREATALLAESPRPVEPPAAMRDSVLAAASTTAQDPGPGPSETSPPAAAPRGARRAHRGRWLLAAAAAVVLVVGGGIALTARPWESGPSTVSAVERVEHATDAQRATSPAGHGSLVMVTSASRGKAVATLRDVPAAPSGKVYQAWIITGGGPVSAGFLRPGKATLLKGSITGAKAAAVTVEPTGGSKQPTSKPIAQVPMT